MADVDQVFRARWRSGKHVGQNAPVQIARVRRIDMDHGHRPFTFLDGSTEDFGTIKVESPRAPWWPLVVPKTPWVTLPNVSQVSKQQGFDNNGFQNITVELENVVYKAIVGIAGVYHAISRGDLSPWRGFRSIGRPAFAQWMLEQNEWYDIIDAAQIEVWQGYGPDHHTKVFTGLVEDVDMTSNPDHMTLTCTCFGDQLLGRQRFFGATKNPKMLPPITFADRRSNEDVKHLGGGARSSSDVPGFPASNVVRNDAHAWRSDGHNAENATEWIEIHLPKGRYEAFGIFPQWSGMEMFVGLKIRDRDRLHDPRFEVRKPAKVDGVPVAADNQWFNPNGTNVPGANGGWPYFRHYTNVAARQQQHSLAHVFEVGDGTILRIGFRRLHRHPMVRRDPGTPFRAGVQRLFAIQRTPKAGVHNNWVLVDDVADVVKIVLRWAGFREWEVEDFGVALDKPLVFHQSNFLIDPINTLAGMADYVFFMGDPTADDLSLGVPKFRRSRALLPPGKILTEVRDKDLLSGIGVKLSKSLKSTRIWARGARATKRQHGLGWIGENRLKGDIGAEYITPWRKKLSGTLRHTVHTDSLMTRQLDTEVMVRLIALKEALQSNTGQIEIPGNPELELDEQLSIVDEGTGTNTRLWTASRQDTFISGQQPSWKTTLGGSWLDTHDVLAVTLDLQAVLQRKRQAANPPVAPNATGGVAQVHTHGVKF